MWKSTIQDTAFWMKKSPDLVAVRTVEVDGHPPGCAVAAGEVGREVAEVVALGSEMVVDHIERHGETTLVAGVDEVHEPGRTAIARLHRIGIDAVVAPVALAGELGDRHDLDRGHAEVAERVEVRDRGVEGALGGERADVELVEDELLAGEAAPGAIVPGVSRDVDDRRGAVHAPRLGARGGIGSLAFPVRAVEPVEVEMSRADTIEDALVIAARGPVEGMNALDRFDDAHLDLFGGRGPDPEATAPPGERDGAEIRRHGSRS